MKSFGSSGDDFWLKAGCPRVSLLKAGSLRDPAMSTACRGVKEPPDFSLASACALLLEPAPLVWQQQAACALLECSLGGSGQLAGGQVMLHEGQDPPAAAEPRMNL